MTTILITGADGFIAPHIIGRLHQRNDNRLVAVAHRPGRAAPAPRIDRAVADLTNPAETLALVERWRPDIVIHAAGQRGPSEDDAWQTEIAMARAIMDSVARATPQVHLVLLGSAAEYGLTANAAPLTETSECRPVAGYGRAKLAVTSEALARARRGEFGVSVLRVFNAIGTGIRPSLAAGAFLAQIKASRRRGEPYLVRMGPRHHVRDFVAADDLATVIERIIARGAFGAIVNVCTGQGRTLDSLLRRMATLAGACVAFEGAVDADCDEPPTFSVGDCSKSLRLLGFAPSANLDATLLAMWQQAIAARSDVEA